MALGELAAQSAFSLELCLEVRLLRYKNTERRLGNGLLLLANAAGAAANSRAAENLSEPQRGPAP